ncbi:alkaline phosphatase family protein [Salinimonas sp. HHU 13199]|uniref:Alkaline phosphatase family protein n=1 Tax=Salinimonas profundi TaxID=2729140 RepID=A0ABR8LL74_9ALTE|nr:alkaline phosphatase family protein [Salinimonas profundi]
MRQVTERSVTVWMITTHDQPADLTVSAEAPLSGRTESQIVQVGSNAFVQLITLALETDLTPGELYRYRINFADEQINARWDQERTALLYTDDEQLNFRFDTELSDVLHGSCRKPHHPVDDALLRVDQLIEQERQGQTKRPDMLLMTGDQVYCDDVAGPMLQAIEQVVDKLGLFHEDLDGAVIDNTSQLSGHEFNFYQRENILPQIELNTALSKLFFGAKKKPVFTSVNAHNHLISLSEVIAMYILVWSDVLWRDVSFDKDRVPDAYQDQFAQEQEQIEKFAAGLPRVRRALAHLPVYMIFDDHDVTDDWNLTRGWEEQVYGNPLSKRMVGNALIGYWLCQGWGNQPAAFDDIVSKAAEQFTANGLMEHDAFIDTLFEFEQWHYTLATSPPVCVLDTRTRRWRSESSLDKPSGLMDWEALCEFQQEIIGKQSVIVVSAAPIYGVKFIEAIQKVFTFFGKALTVDAENWMAHKGTANVILNIFRHYKTPPSFIILSGDVHYSFVYDVRLRFRRNSPHITQFTCSGLKNTFPDKLLKKLETLNRWLYSRHSPLNVFTRRRKMSVRAREIDTKGADTLLNHSAVGQLILNQDDEPAVCRALCADQDTIEFPPHHDDD